MQMPAVEGGLARDPTLRRLSQICLALPGASRKIMADHAIFQLRGKPFAYLPYPTTTKTAARQCAAAPRGAKTRIARIVNPRAAICPAISANAAGSACVGNSATSTGATSANSSPRVTR
jgi:hypothetical protein